MKSLPKGTLKQVASELEYLAAVVKLKSVLLEHFSAILMWVMMARS